MNDLIATEVIEAEHVRLLYYDFNDYLSTNYTTKNYLRFCSILEGYKYVNINKGQKIKYDKKSFIILTPNSDVNLEILEKTKALVVEIDQNYIDEVVNKLSIEYDSSEFEFIDKNFFLGKYNFELLDTYKKIIDVFKSESANKKFLIDLYSQKIIYDIFKYKGAERIINKKGSDINLIISYIKENYNKNIRVSDLAKELGMKEYEFTRYFKKYTGKTPKEFIKDLRLLKAKELLAYESVTDVCFDIGYENISYFIKEFKNKYGLTPKQFINTRSII